MKHKNLTLLLILLFFNLSALLAQPQTAPAEQEPDYAMMANNIFDKLYIAEMSTVSDIEWTSLVIQGDSLGVNFNALQSDVDKQAFQAQTIQNLSYWLQIDKEFGDFYDLNFQVINDYGCFLYGITDYFDVYLDFKIIDGKLLLFNVDFEEY